MAGKKGVGGRWARGQGLSECEVGERAGRKNEVKDEVHGRDAYGGGRQGARERRRMQGKDQWGGRREGKVWAEKGQGVRVCEAQEGVDRVRD